MTDISKRDLETLMFFIDKEHFGSVRDEIERGIQSAYRWGYQDGYNDARKELEE